MTTRVTKKMNGNFKGGEADMNALPEPAPKDAEPLTPSAYNALVASARLRDIRLLKSTFVLDPDAVNEESSLKLAQGCEIRASYFNEAAETLLAFVTAEATCTKKRKRVVSVKCEYLIVYGVSGHPSESAVTAFAKRVARFAAYPYFRAHFAELASQGGLHLPPLPIIKEHKLLPGVAGIEGIQKQIAPPASGNTE